MGKAVLKRPNSQTKIFRAEEIAYFFMVKRSVTLDQDESVLLENAKNEDDFDAKLIQILKRNTLLHVLVDKNYGQLVNTMHFPNGAAYPEFYRISQNHELWARKYIKAEVSRDFLISISKTKGKGLKSLSECIINGKNEE